MPLSGGSSDQFGGRFQDRWTAHCIFDVLRDRAEAIRLEPPPAETEGFEFWIRFPDRVAYHQVKRQVTGEGRWSLSALRDAGVLRAFADKLSDPAARCVFTSAHAAPVLEELADRAGPCQRCRRLRPPLPVRDFVAHALSGTDGQLRRSAARDRVGVAPPHPC